MDGAVKMPEAQLNINTANRAKTTQASDSGTEFIKLLQAKGSQTKASSQDKTQQTTENDTKTSLSDTKETLSEDTGKKPEDLSETAEDLKTSDTEEMAQQAAVQQTAALLAGMFTEPQEVTAEETAPETETLSAVGELLTENTSTAPEVPETVETVETQLSSMQNLPETQPEVNPETAFTQSSVQETTQTQEPLKAEPQTKELQTKEPQTKELQTQESLKQEPQTKEPTQAESPRAEASQAESQQKVNEAAEKTPKAEENKTEEVKSATEPVQNMSASQKTEEKPETGNPSNQENLTGKDNRKTEENRISEGENGQTQAAAGTESFRVFGNQEQNTFFNQKTETVSVKTTPETMPEDLGKALGAKLADGARTLTVELEPASLGKLTIRLTYEGDRAAVSIIATNPKTLELLNQKASEIAAILEEKTGQQTIIFTQKPETNQENYDREPNSRGNQEDQEEKKQQKEEHHQMESFAQQLRLGLV